MNHEEAACSSSSDQRQSNSTKYAEQRQLKVEIARRVEAENEVDVLRQKLQQLEAKLAVSDADATASATSSPKNRFPASSESGKNEADEITLLKTENERLRSYVKRQNALIDVLKRQKILLEASSALTISTKDFVKDLELTKP